MLARRDLGDSSNYTLLGLPSAQIYALSFGSGELTL